MIRRPPRSTRTDTSFPTRRSSDLDRHYVRRLALHGSVSSANRSQDRRRSGCCLCLVTDRPDPRLHSCRSEEHTSELQSLMRISYAVFCLKKKKNKTTTHNINKETETKLDISIY